MGLYGNLNDVQSESLPLFLVILIANSINYLKSIVLDFFHFLGFSRSSSDIVNQRLLLSSGFATGLAGLIVLSENRSTQFGEDGVESSSDDCIVCLCRLREGEQVRKLACRHVFHKSCLDGWLYDHYNLTCPLCRSPLVSEERFAVTERRVAGDLVTWFGVR
ncbi:RING-type E3 ubiquitin transferase [Ranunculus cassubicifolius]